MTKVMERINSSLEELEALAMNTTDAAEREGILAFINNLAPHLLTEEGPTATVVGKINDMYVDAPLETDSIERLISQLSDKYHVVIE